MKMILTRLLFGLAFLFHSSMGIHQADAQPVILAQPTNQTAVIYSTAVFTVVADGPAPLEYQWLFNDAPILAETNSSLALNVVLPDQSGNYSVIVSNASGSVTSSNAVLTVIALPPSVTRQPTNVTAYIAQTVVFSIQATGTPILSYQWLFNGAPIPGRTGTILTLNNLQTTNAGVYACIVSNAYGAATSSNAVLVVRTPPNCLPVPLGLVSWWRAETNALDAWDSNNGMLPFIQTQYEAGKVGRAFRFAQTYVLVPESLSLQTSNAFTLEAWVKPSSSNSTLRTIISRFDFEGVSTIGTTTGGSCYYLGLTNGNRVIFKVSASGSPKTNVTSLVSLNGLPTNEWSHVAATFGQGIMRIFINGQQSMKAVHSGGVFPSSYGMGIGAIPNIIDSFVSPGNYFFGSVDEVSVYNRELSEFEVRAIYDSDITGKCMMAPNIVTQPKDQAIPLGEDVKFTVDVLGTRPLLCQWYFNNSRILGATNTTLVLEKIGTNRAGLYHIAVTNSAGSALSARASLTLLPGPTCIASANGMISWWPADGNGLDAMGLNNGTSFGMTYVTGKVSRAFNLVPPNSQLQIPTSSSLNIGSNVDFTIEAWIKMPPTNMPGDFPFIQKRIAGGGLVAPNVGYALSLNQGRLSFWIASGSSATNVSQFTAPGPNLYDGMFHHVAVTLIRSSTNGGRLYVDGQPVLTFNASQRNGSLASSSPLTFGNSIRALIIPTFSGLLDEPALYNRALSASEIMAITQAGAAGRCKAPPTILVHPVPQKVTIGSNVTFSVSAIGTPALRYQWLIGGQPIIGATNTVYTFAAKGSGFYSVRVTNLFGGVTSSNILFTANFVPSVPASVAVTCKEDSSAPVTLLAMDENNDPLNYIIVAAPTNGILTGSAGNRVYTPAPNFFGKDSFSYKVNDGLVDSRIGVVNITVQPINDAPFVDIVVAPLSHLPGETNLQVIAPACSDAEVVLDGSRSWDVEKDPLQYSWSEGTNVFAQGFMTTNRFAPGVHEISLVVSDGSAVSSNSVQLEILAPGSAVDLLADWIAQSDLDRRRVQPLLSLLRAAASSFDRCHALAGAIQLTAFQLIIDGKVKPMDPAMAETLDMAAQEIIDAAGVFHPRDRENQVSGAAVPANGKFQVTFSGAISRVHFVEASTDLVHWTVIGVARDCGNGSFDFEDVNSSQHPRRFYRIRE
jgi:hypothetical protein